MINKQYTVKLGNELHLSRLISSDSSKNSIALKIQEQSKRLNLTTNKDLIVSQNKQIGTRTFISNTSRVVATDIVVEGIPYLYKWLKFTLPGYTPKYSTSIYEPAGQWIYSTQKDVSVIMQDSDGVDRFSLDLEFIPVFIDSRFINLKDFITMDGRYFTPKRKGGVILSTFSKDVQYIEVQNNVFESYITSTDDMTDIEIEEFIYELPAKIENKNAIVKYEYFPFQHTLIRSFKETRTIGPNGIIELSNRNIDLSNIFIKKINNVATNLTIVSIVSPMSGKLCVAPYMQSGMLNDGDVVEFEYNYLFIDKPSISINTRKLNADSSINTYIGPTEISGRNILYRYEKHFGAVVCQKDFVVGDVFSFTTIDIGQSGNTYSYDYAHQNEIQFIDGNIVESFYTDNISNVDTYLNSKKFKSCGTYRIVDSLPTYVECGERSSIKEDFFDFETYSIYTGSVVILGSDESTVSAGIGKIQNESVFPLTFNVDHEIPGYIYLKINVDAEESMNLSLADSEVVDFCTQADEVDLDFTYDKNKFSACYITGTSEINANASLFFDSNTKDFYAKITKIPNTEVRLKFAGLKSGYGITI